MDSDEEEMAAMRASRGGGRGGASKPAACAAASTEKAPVPAVASRGGSDSDDAGPRRRRVGPQRPPSRFGRETAEDGRFVEVDGRGAERCAAEAAAAEEDAEATGEVQGLLGFMSFGKQKKAAATPEQAHNGQRRPERRHRGVALGGATAAGVTLGPKPPPAAPEAPAAASSPPPAPARGTGAAEESDPEGEIEPPPPSGKESEVLPMSHEVIIAGHEKPVSALGLDPKGSRMITGGIDGQFRFYDFNGMNESKQAFRSLEPAEGYQATAVSWAPSGGHAMVALSDSYCRIYDREGSSKPIQMTVKGDMYVRTLENTKGHTQSITGGMWHPLLVERWLSSSLDGSMRIWDLRADPTGMDQHLPCISVLKCVDKRGVCVGGASGQGGGVHPTCCAVAPTDAKRIVGGCSDGSLQVFFEKPRYLKPDKVVRKAHAEAFTGLAFLTESGRSDQLATRSLDGTMKVWDLRVLSDEKGPVHTIADLPCAYEKTGVIASSNGRYLVTGTSFRKHAKSTSPNATLRLYDTKDLKLVKTLDFGKRSVICLDWPEALNQLVVGTSTGETVLLYSPYSSKSGALHFVGRRAKVKTTDDLEFDGNIPIFNMTDREDQQRFYSTGHANMFKIRRGEARRNQITVTPELPARNDGSDSTATPMSTWVQHVIAQNAVKKKRPIPEDEDIQKSLLQQNVKDPLLGKAYKESGVTPLNWDPEQSEGDIKMQQSMLKGDFCRKCGQKVCRCVDYSDWSKKRPKTS